MSRTTHIDMASLTHTMRQTRTVQLLALACISILVECAPRDLPQSMQQTTSHAAPIPTSVANADRSKRYYMHEMDNNGGINDGQVR